MAFGIVFRNFGSALRAHGFIFRDGRRTLGVQCINKSGSSIAKDKLVAVSGYDTTSKRMKIVLADADAANLATEVFVTAAAISNNAKGHVYKGLQSAANLDTSGVSAAGDPVYLSQTAGGFTATAPADGNARVLIVGYAIVKSSTLGQIHWDIQPPQKTGSNDVNQTYGRSAAATAAVASVAALTPTADGSFEVWANVLPTTIGSGSFTVTCAYTDESNSARTANMPFFLVGGTTATVATVSTGAPYQGLPLHIRVKGGTSITLASAAGGTYTGCTYNIEGAIKQVA